jgi:hypothetical protein
MAMTLATAMMSTPSKISFDLPKLEETSSRFLCLT